MATKAKERRLTAEALERVRERLAHAEEGWFFAQIADQVAEHRTFSRGEVVFHRVDPADSLHLVDHGRFGARVLTPLGDSVIIDVLGPGQSFGELALLLPDARRSATVEALEPGETRSVFRDDFAVLQREHSGVKDVLLRLLAEQLRRSTDRVVEAHYVDAETRVRRRLGDLAATYESGRRAADPGGHRRDGRDLTRDGEPRAARGEEARCRCARSRPHDAPRPRGARKPLPPNGLARKVVEQRAE